MVSALKQVYRIVRFWLRERLRFFPSYPNTINFDITYRCNSRCSMCNIWRHERTIEFSTEELRSVLSKRLFKKVEHVGLTGGEPSLRKDFPEIVDTLIETLPRLKSLSIITNCVSPACSERIIQFLFERCQSARIQFGLVLSMDGIGPYHDKNRGVKGNYTSLLSVIDFVTKESIPFSLGYTITKNNISSIYEAFELARQNKWSIYFAIAEFIDRLNNQDCDAIQSFSEDEKYELLLFFHKLMNDPHISSLYRRSYWKDFEILSGRERPIGCPYHKEGIVLSPTLEVGHCAVKGKIVGNAKDDTITSTFFKTWFSNKKYVKQFCNSCFHYHYQKNSKEEWITLKNKVIRRIISPDKLNGCLLLSRFLTRPNLQRYILIVGWYGTETVGDKAILGTVINNYARQGFNVVIASIYPFITRRTLQELDLDAVIIKSESLDLIRYSKFAEKVVMGGGPLMDLYDLKYPLISFQISHEYHHENVIYGCGIGPMKSRYYADEIYRILALSDTVTLRDSDSVRLFKARFPEKEVEQVEDPAVGFIKERAGLVLRVSDGKTLACFFRKVPKEFLDGKEEWEDRLAIYIRSLVRQEKLTRVVLYSMHNFWVGNDDREYARYFKAKYFSGTEEGFTMEVDNSLSTVDNTIERMKSAEMVLCMRFHSMLFAHSLGVNYRVVDYTNGGKTKAFLKDHDCLSHLVDLSCIK